MLLNQPTMPSSIDAPSQTIPSLVRASRLSDCGSWLSVCFTLESRNGEGTSYQRSGSLLNEIISVPASSGRLDLGENLADYGIGVGMAALGPAAGNEPVGQHRLGQMLDIVGDDVVAA